MNKAGRLLGGHAFGSLTDEERRELYGAALEDQAMFDELAEQEPIRELLADRAVRKDLLEVLDTPTIADKLRAFLQRPATWADLAVTASLLAVALVATHFLSLGRVDVPRAASASPALLRALFDLRAGEPTGDELRVEPGRLRFRVERDAQVIVASRTPAGAFVQLFPGSGRGARVQAGLTMTVDWPHEETGFRVRLAVFPVAVDPLALDPTRLRDLRPRVIEWNGGPKGGTRR
jgi:hypothetical protein